MPEFPAMPMWWGDFLVATEHLSDAEGWVYTRLLGHMWRSPDGRFPNDFDWICRKVRGDPKVVRKVLDEFCRTDGNYVTQKRLQEVLVVVRGKTRSRSVSAKLRENNKRHEHSVTTEGPQLKLKSNIKDKKERDANASPKKDAPQDSQISACLKAKPAAKRATRLDPNWRLDDLGREYAIGQGYSPDEADHIAQEFHHHWTNGNGHTKTHVDWNRTWQVWIRNAPERGKPPGFLAGRQSGNGLDANPNRRGDGGLAGAAARVLDRCKDVPRQ